jgi:putative membrane protein
MLDLHNRPGKPKEYLRLFLTGAAMGTADPIPGVSGGTMAFILGVYEDLLAGIKSINLEFIKLLLQFKFKEAFSQVPWKFLLTLGLGVFSALLLLANIIGWLLDNHAVYLFSFFFGLVLASIIAIGARVQWALRTVGTVIAGTLIALFIVTRIPVDMPHDPLTLFLSSTVSTCAMILPGISGSFILLILGQYAYVIDAVRNMDILTLLPVALGSVVGLLSFARLLSWLLNRYEQATIAALVGFMIGSLYKIWPWKVVLEWGIDRHGDPMPLIERNIAPDVASSAFWLSLALCVAGFLLVSLLDHLQSRENPLFRLFRRRDAAALPDTDAKSG